MKRKRFSEEQIAFALRQAKSGVQVKEICRSGAEADSQSITELTGGT